MPTTTKLEEIIVPERYTLEQLSGRDTFLLKSPSGFMATVDFEKRLYRSGLVRHGKGNNALRYGGRGWKQRLLNEAITHLARIEAERA